MFFFFQFSNIINRTRQSNISFIATLDSNTTKFQKRLGPALEKPGLVLRQALHLNPGPAVAHQNRIRLKQPSVRQNVFIVLIIEHQRRRRIVVHGSRGAGAGRAAADELVGVGAVEGGVDEGELAVWASSEAVAEGAAVGRSDGVGPGEDHEIVRRQPFCGEQTHHLVH